MSSISNPVLDNAILTLRLAHKKTRSRIWRAAAEALSGARSRRPEVNVGKISRLSKSGELVLVPGKVLGAGLLEHKLVVGAFSFSQSARTKIAGAGGKPLSLVDFVKKHSKAKGVKLIGG